MVVPKWDKTFHARPSPACCVLKMHLCSFCPATPCSQEELLLVLFYLMKVIKTTWPCWGCWSSGGVVSALSISVTLHCPVGLFLSAAPHLTSFTEQTLAINGGFSLCIAPAGQGAPPSKELKKRLEQNQPASQQVSGSLTFTEHRHLTCHEHRHGKEWKTCNCKYWNHMQLKHTCSRSFLLGTVVFCHVLPLYETGSCHWANCTWFFFCYWKHKKIYESHLGSMKLDVFAKLLLE